MRPYVRTALLLSPAIAVYCVLANRLNFVQDDAFITFRYIANFLHGYGLVYNVGERVEGFTNFGWTIYLTLWGAFGASYIVAAKVTGFLLGAITIVVTYKVASRVFPEDNAWWALLPAYLVGVNPSLAYWAPAGLETAAFVCAVALTVYYFLARNYLLIAALALAVWLRPEGAVLAMICLGAEFLPERRTPIFSLRCGLLALLLSLPYVAFKFFYYGSILPNPFYAKTGFSVAQMSSGIEYATEFLKDYGFWGVGLIVPLLFAGRLRDNLKEVWLFAVMYTVYVVLIGGDVLKVHRFFLPLLFPYAILAAASLYLIVRHVERRARLVLMTVIGILLLGMTVSIPWKKIKTFNLNEQGLIAKMTWLSAQMKASDTTMFSVATSTIGVFGYELLEHRVIDMLGLTDSTIARHHEEPITGLQSTWKELSINSRSLLERAPEYIVFSTGIKPSAPAEQALLMYPQFVSCYRNFGWVSYDTLFGAPEGMLISTFRKGRPVSGPFERKYPIEWVEQYRRGIEADNAGDYDRADARFAAALKVPGCPDYPEMYHFRSMIELRRGRPLRTLSMLDSALVIDSAVQSSQRSLYMLEVMRGNHPKASIHRSWLERNSPWLISQADSLLQISEKQRQAEKTDAQNAHGQETPK